MAESTLSLKYSTLRALIGNFLGYGRTSGNWTAAQIADIQETLDSGLRQFYNPPVMPGERTAHKWRFMRPVTSLTTSAAYTTGTIGIASGVVTLTTGTFPSWAAEGEITVNGATYTIYTRDSDTQVTLDDTSVTLSSGRTYTLNRVTYELPADFGGIDGDFTYQSRVTLYPTIPITGEGEIRRLRQSSSATTGGTSTRATIAAIRPKASSGSDGQRFEVLFWPNWGAAYQLEYRYHAYQNTLSSDLYPLGGEAHAETILESCLAIAEQRLDDEQGLHTAKFMERLAASIAHDQSSITAEFLGPNRDRSDGPDDENDRRTQGGNYVTYNGILPS